MEQLKVKDLMVPLADYATVSEDASLYDAVVALGKAQKAFNKDRDKHRAILVLDKNGYVIGKLSQMDVIKGLEPNYEKIGSLRDTSRFGFSPDFMRSLIKNYGLWDRPLRELCKKAAVKKVSEIMYRPTEGEYVNADDTLDQGIHQLIFGHHQSLLVMRRKQIVGILRLSDVFREICSMIESCSI
ncbi:MAG: CBS domain-containing protein [Thermodesulfobacteriota bacterium]